MTPVDPEKAIILMVDDDVDDCEMTQRALRATPLAKALKFAHDGADLMDYLHRRGPHAVPGAAPRPDLILLDLNMPRMSGQEALRAIKNDAAFRSIPIVIMTTSKASEDVLHAYELGANAFVTKPVMFSALCEVMRKLSEFWFDVAERPHSVFTTSDTET